MTAFRLILSLVALLLAGPPAAAETVLSKFLPDMAAGDLVAGAEAFGPERPDLAAAPVLKGGETIGWAFITSDFVGTTGVRHQRPWNSLA